MLYDITPTITSDLTVWPGDTPASREVLMDIARGHTVTLSTLRATVHLGAHADAPSHYGDRAPSIEARSLEYYFGPCRVVHVKVKRDERFGLGHLSESQISDLKSQGGVNPTPRVLFRTGTYPDPTKWNEDFAAFDPAFVDFLHEQGVILAGLDTPSVDLFHSKALESHKRFLAHDMAILEGVVLTVVPEGVYELIALPLKLAGFDASPVRAVLRKSRNVDPRTDAQLVALANAGDVAGFEGLYRRHRDWAVSVAWRFTGSREEALDVAQEAFVWLMRQFPGFELRAKMRTVLYPVVRSIALTGRRRQRTRDIHLPSLFDLASSELNQREGESERTERQRALSRALDELSDEHREVLLMRFVDDMSLEEIAHALGIPVGTVKSRLHHAARSLRNAGIAES